MSAPIITEEILRRYLLCKDVDPAEVSRIGGTVAHIEWKVAEGWDALFDFEDPEDEHEYHAALGAVAMAEIALQFGTGRQPDPYKPDNSPSIGASRMLAKYFLEAAGVTPEAWEATR